MANIILNTDDLTLTIEERGETNTVSNVGSGAGVFKEKTGSDLRLRSIGGGAHVTTTENTDDITIDVVWDQNIVPTADESYDLGSAASKFKELYTKDFTIVDANDRGEIASPRGVYWQSTAGNIEVDSTANDIVLRTDASNKVHIINNLTIDGDLDVNGNLTTIDTVNLQVEDAIIEINRGNNGADAGVLIQRGDTGENAVLVWKESDNEFKLAYTLDDATATDITVSALANLNLQSLELNGSLLVFGGAQFLSNVQLHGSTVYGAADIIGEEDSDVTLRNFDSSSIISLSPTGVQVTGLLTLDDGVSVTSGDVVADTLEARTLVDTPAVTNVGGTDLQLRTDNGNTTLTLDETLGVTVNSSASIQGDLDVSGKLTTTSNTVNIKLPAVIVDTADSGSDVYVRPISAKSDFSDYHTLATRPDQARTAIEFTHIGSDASDVVGTIEGVWNATDSNNEVHIVAKDTDNSNIIGRLKQTPYASEFNTPFQYLRVPSGTTEPVSPNEGAWFFNTDTNLLKRYGAFGWSAYGENGWTFYDLDQHIIITRINSAWHSINTTAL